MTINSVEVVASQQSAHDHRKTGWVIIDDTKNPIIKLGSGSSGGDVEGMNAWKVHISIDPTKLKFAIPHIIDMLNKPESPRIGIKFLAQGSIDTGNYQSAKEVSLLFYPDALSTVPSATQMANMKNFLQNVANRLSEHGIGPDPKSVNPTDEKGIKEAVKWDKFITYSDGSPSYFSYRDDDSNVVPDESQDENIEVHRTPLKGGSVRTFYVVKASYFQSLPLERRHNPGGRDDVFERLELINPLRAGVRLGAAAAAADRDVEVKREHKPHTPAPITAPAAAVVTLETVTPMTKAASLPQEIKDAYTLITEKDYTHWDTDTLKTKTFCINSVMEANPTHARTDAKAAAADRDVEVKSEHKPHTPAPITAPAAAVVTLATVTPMTKAASLPQEIKDAYTLITEKDYTHWDTEKLETKTFCINSVMEANPAHARTDAKAAAADRDVEVKREHKPHTPAPITAPAAAVVTLETVTPMTKAASLPQEIKDAYTLITEKDYTHWDTDTLKTKTFCIKSVMEANPTHARTDAKAASAASTTAFGPPTLFAPKTEAIRSVASNIKYESLDDNVKAALSMVTKGNRKAISDTLTIGEFWSNLSPRKQQDWLAIANKQIEDEQNANRNHSR